MKYEVKESSGNLMMEKSFSFALRIVKLYQHLSEKKKEYHTDCPLWIMIW